MHTVNYHPRAIKFLRQISKELRDRILQKTGKLIEDPFSKSLNIKRLIDSEKSCRLRIGKIRVIFELDEINKIIHITKIDFRGNVYS